MGYYLMPEAEDHEVNLQLLAAEATRVFLKTHGTPAKGLDIQVDVKRRILNVTDQTTKVSEMFTFAELGFF